MYVDCYKNDDMFFNYLKSYMNSCLFVSIAIATTMEWNPMTNTSAYYFPIITLSILIFKI